MDDRLETVIQDLTKLDIVKEGKYLLDIVVDDEDEPLGVSIKDEKDELREVIWIETNSLEGLYVEALPEGKEWVRDSQELWTMLYCISSNIRTQDENPEGKSISEIAEEIYEGSFGLQSKRNNSLGELEEVAMELDLDTIEELILTYNREEIDLLVDFVNTIAILHGIEFELDLVTIDGDTGKEVSGAILSDKQPQMDSNYVYQNTSVLINKMLVEGGELDREGLMFLNQIIYERAKMDKKKMDGDGLLGG